MSRLIGAALVCFAASLLFAVVETPLEAQAPAPADPLDLFATIYPVFTHPRCVNCHGVVQTSTTNIRVLTGVGHRGGAVTLADDCGDCHHTPEVLVEAWQFTAPSSMSWVGLNLEQLCSLQSQQVRGFGNAGYMHHLTEDPLITQAFDGRAGGQLDPAAKPPLSRSDFLAAAQAWVDAGAGCSRLSGSVFKVESLHASYSYPYPVKDGRTTINESARQELSVFRRTDGTAYALVNARGTGTITTVYRDTGVNGPCTVTINANTSWSLKEPRQVDNVTLEINRQANGDYTIGIVVPSLTITSGESGDLQQDCGIQLPPPGVADPPIETTWPPVKFVIHCPANFTPDADNTITCSSGPRGRPPLLNGSLKRTLKEGQGDPLAPASWLNTSPAGTSRADDGSPIPITINTIWNLSLPPAP